MLKPATSGRKRRKRQHCLFPAQNEAAVKEGDVTMKGGTFPQSHKGGGTLQEL